MEYIIKTLIPLLIGVSGLWGLAKIFFSQKVPKIIAMELSQLKTKIEDQKKDTDKFKQAFREDFQKNCATLHCQIEKRMIEFEKEQARLIEKTAAIQVDFAEYQGTIKSLERIVDRLERIINGKT